ncbi:Haloalkane dehalogenase [Chondrus crispus]|uniref:Haloalkane dehalogenase n=1 Tax=Chondrus crispus TaxID=2769 RepID=R7QDG0_CHOCR|nr:Haloalkane dehalogenase [Chondrus crispus]CDF36114.1 Haloalkane dehalogenase [Chondrus crispus]|eukprot:XP_005715933.1 Haloalkane dehalogenase [Chondrus crispus]
MIAKSTPMQLFVLALLLAATICNGTGRPTGFPPRRFLEKKFADIDGKKMAYVEVGTGDPIVFLHGNPTSSFLWRNVMPHLEGRGRLIAPDLIGMGDSDKLDNSNKYRYTFLEHSNYLYRLFEIIGVKERVTFVIHDWGTALGFHWAYLNRKNPNSVKGIAFFEGFVSTFERYGDFPEEIEPFFRVLRSPAGEQLVLEDNAFVEDLIPSAILRNLTKPEFDEYRRPFLKAGEDRRPMLTWPRQVPIEGEPAEVVAIVKKYSKWLARSELPKLFIDGKPGLISPSMRAVVKKWKNTEMAAVKGIHYLQEDSPTEIGKAIAKWLP